METARRPSGESLLRGEGAPEDLRGGRRGWGRWGDRKQALRSEGSPLHRADAAHETLRPSLTVPEQLAMYNDSKPAAQHTHVAEPALIQGNPSSHPLSWGRKKIPPHPLESKFLPVRERDGNAPPLPIRVRAGENVCAWSPFCSTQM